MAGIKISNLPAVVTPTLADILPIVQAGITEKATLQQVLTLILANLNSGTGLTDGQILIGSTSNPPVATTLTAGMNISVVNAAGSITISATGAGGFSWTTVTGTTQTMVTNNGYFANNGSLVTFTLPPTAAIGDELAVIGQGAGGWIIHQNASQSIHIGSVASTVGTGGSVASTNRYDSIDLICSVTNTTWTSLGGPQGNLTIV